MQTNILENDIVGSIGTQKYLCTIVWRNGTLVMDEPTTISGQDLGPDPYSTLLASLAGCTLSTLRMYIDRKGWDIPEISVKLNMYQNDNLPLETTITREISFSTAIDDEIKQRLLIVAEKCPVSKILKNSVYINTNI